MTETDRLGIRPECFFPAKHWQQPTPDEVREILKQINTPQGLKGSEAAILLGVGGRQIRRWTGGDAPIPFAAWAILADMAGKKAIWIERQE